MQIRDVDEALALFDAGIAERYPNLGVTGNETEGVKLVRYCRGLLEATLVAACHKTAVEEPAEGKKAEEVAEGQEELGIVEG
jgi:hypothetical protein